MPLFDELPLPEPAERTANAVRQSALIVHREVGPGSREAVYQRCLSHVLREKGHCVEEHVSLAVGFRGLIIHRAGEVDMIVDDQVVIELKARESIHAAHRAQLLSYLRATDKPLGFVLNFHAAGILRDGYERMVHPRYLIPRKANEGSRVPGFSGESAKRGPSTEP